MFKIFIQLQLLIHNFYSYSSLKIVNKAMHVISKGIPKKNISSNVLKVVFMAQLVLGQLIRSLKEIKELLLILFNVLVNVYCTNILLEAMESIAEIS